MKRREERVDLLSGAETKSKKDAVQNMEASIIPEGR